MRLAIAPSANPKDAVSPPTGQGSIFAPRRKAVEYNEAAFAIAGHHAGLPDPKGGKACLSERTKEVDVTLEGLWLTAVQDCPELSACKDLLVGSSEKLTNFDLRTRMLFSCLVDADRIDSSGAHKTGQLPAAAERLDRLLVQLDLARRPRTDAQRIAHR